MARGIGLNPWHQATNVKTMKPVLFPAKTSSPMLLVEYGPIGQVDQVSSDVLPDGLLAAHTLTQSNGDRTVLTYWASEADFRRDGATFGARFTTGASASPRGYVGSPIAHPTPWYKRVTPLTWILSLTTLLGAVDALVHRYEEWFSAPQVFIKPETRDTNVQHAVRNLPLNVKFSVRNPLDIALRDVRVTAFLQPQGTNDEAACRDCERMFIDEPNSVTLAPRDSIPLVAQLPNVNRFKEGRWEAVVKATASAGSMRDENSFERRIPVQIWLPLSVEPVNWEPQGLQAAVLSAQIKVGLPLPKGMSCSATVQGIREPRTSRATLSDMYGQDLIQRDSFEWPRATGESGAKQFKVNWKTVAVDRAFSDLYLKMRVEGPADTEWGHLNGKTKVECFPIPT